MKLNAYYMERFKKWGKMSSYQGITKRQRRKFLIPGRKGPITTDFTDIKMIPRDSYKQLYARLLNILAGIDKLVDEHSLPKLTQKAIEYLSLNKIK